MAILHKIYLLFRRELLLYGGVEAAYMLIDLLAMLSEAFIPLQHRGNRTQTVNQLLLLLTQHLM